MARLGSARSDTPTTEAALARAGALWRAGNRGSSVGHGMISETVFALIGLEGPGGPRQVAGLYFDREDAERGARKLSERGVDSASVSIVEGPLTDPTFRGLVERYASVPVFKRASEQRRFHRLSTKLGGASESSIAWRPRWAARIMEGTALVFRSRPVPFPGATRSVDAPEFASAWLAHVVVRPWLGAEARLVHVADATLAAALAYEINRRWFPHSVATALWMQRVNGAGPHGA